MADLTFEIKDSVGYISMNRPDKYNSFTREMALLMQDALKASNSDESVRVVVIRGNGKAFCAGQDLVEAVDPQMPKLGQILEEHLNPLVDLIVHLNKPVIAAINGVAAGAGANIAFACDITIAKESVSFIQAFSKIGLIPDTGGTYTLPRLIGHAKASALMMLGDKVSASEAERIGMIYRVVSDETFDEEVNKLIQKVANMPTQALVNIKKILHQTWGNNLAQQLKVEKQYQIASGNTSDHQEGVNAFIEKRKAVFTGK